MSRGHMCDFVGCRCKEQVEFSLCGLKSWCFDILVQLKLHFLPLKGKILPLILPCLPFHTQPPSKSSPPSRTSNCVLPLVWLPLLLAISLPSPSIHTVLSWGLKEISTLAQCIRAWGTKKMGETNVLKWVCWKEEVRFFGTFLFCLTNAYFASLLFPLLPSCFGQWVLVTVILTLLVETSYDRHQEQEKDKEKTNYLAQCALWVSPVKKPPVDLWLIQQRSRVKY